MKKILFSLLYIFSLPLFAQLDNSREAKLLEGIQSGYIKWAGEELKSAANNNKILAQYYLAICYEEGIIVEQNLYESFKLYRKAAERGLADAMYHLSLFYKNGVVVDKNENRSKEWLQRFQSKGGKLSCPDLLSIYNEGLNHPENFFRDPLVNSNEISSSTLITCENKQSGNTFNNITIIQKSQSLDNVENDTVINQSDVDNGIPSNPTINNNTFVVIICNEQYQEEVNVEYAINDGEIFFQYCRATIGIPTDNIHIRKNATLNNIKGELSWMKKVADAYKGNAKFIFYYAGHGVPDESNGTSYLLPVDGQGTVLETGYCLVDLYKILGSLPSSGVYVFMDACFSGSKRGEGMLTAARGIAIKAKPQRPQGNMIVFTAAQGDETAYPYKEKKHGLFTYFLLKKLQESNGEVSLGELSSYLTEQVGKRSIVMNGKSQTPSVSVTVSMGESWRAYKLK